MGASGGTLEAIAVSLARLLQPLADRLDAGELRLLLAELGLQFPSSLDGDAALVGEVRSIVTQLERLSLLIATLTTAIQADDVSNVVSAGSALAGAIHDVVAGLENLGANLKAAGGGGISAAELNQFAGQLPGRLIDYLAVRQLEAIPGAAQALDFIDVVERARVPAMDPAHPAFIKRILHFDQLIDFVKHPGGHLKTLYGWGDPGFDGLSLLTRAHDLLTDLGLPAILDTSGPRPVLDLIFLEIAPATTLGPPGLSLKITHAFELHPTQRFQQDAWQIRIVGNLKLDVGAEILVQPNDHLTVIPPVGQVSGEIGIESTGGTLDGPAYVILGESGGSRFEMKQVTARASVGLSAGTNQSESAIRVGGNVRGGKVVVSLGGADGFIGTLIGSAGLESDVDLDFGFSTKDGVFFQGSTALVIQLPMHVALGPIELVALSLSVGLEGGGIRIGAAADIKGSFGPLQAVVQQLGFTADLTLPADRKGNIGPVDVSFAFKPPTGVGLSLDAGVVKGGGFLSIDVDRGEYAGALQLIFGETLSLSAIGVITTKMPDGSSGFSLLIVITADFGAGIQLGFGFTLLAVGGLLGLNRVMLFQPLLDGVRTGAIDNVMFPHDVIANAPRIISDLRAIFPPQQGTFLIGPMAKLGWGEPTLVSLSLGVIIEIPPGDIAILGVLKMALPAEELAILVLQVNFAGALEFSKSRLYFFASLFDSHILFITLDGEMGVLFAYGGNSNFVISVGGCHPQFNPPPLPFPTPRRISLDIINESYARIHADGYFAVTTNSVQFGTHASYFFGFSALSVEGHSGFDALIQFSPFHFSVSISTSFCVHVFGVGVWGIGIDLTLEGPTPYHAHGTASIALLFFSIDIGIDFTWGDSRNTTLPPVAVMPILAGEFAKRTNWRAMLPAGSNLLVSLRKLDSSEAQFVLHPVGTLQISQRVIPLDLVLDKVGNQKPSDANRFALTVTSPDLTKSRNLQESFAPGQFKALSDGDKLSQAAYAPQDSGIELAAAGHVYASGTAISRIVRYDLTIIDTKLRRSRFLFFPYPGALFAHFLNGSSVALSSFSAHQSAQTHPFEGAVTVATETFAVAHQADCTVFRPESAAFSSRAAANDYLDRTIAGDPSLEGKLHVLPAFEVVA